MTRPVWTQWDLRDSPQQVIHHIANARLTNPINPINENTRSRTATNCQKNGTQIVGELQRAGKAIPTHPCKTVPSKHDGESLSLLSFDKRFKYRRFTDSRRANQFE